MASAIRHRFYVLVWAALAATVSWANLNESRMFFQSSKDLSDFTEPERASVLAAMERLHITPELVAWYWAITDTILFVVYLALGWLLVRKGKPAGFSAWLAITVLAMTWMKYPPEIPIAFADQPMQQILARVTTFLAMFGFMTLPMVFPNGRFVPRWSVFFAGYTAIILVSFILLGTDSPSRSPAWEVVSSAILVLSVLGSALYRYFRVLDAEERRQARWVQMGILIGLPSFLAGDAMMRNIDGSLQGALFLVGFMVLIQVGFNAPFIMMALAVLYHRLFNIDVIFGRTIIWIVMSSIVVGVYMAIVVGIGSIFSGGNSLLLSILATGAVAVSFQPVKQRIQRMIDRWIYGDRNDPYRVMSQIGRQLADGAGFTDTLPHLVRLTADALRLPYIALLIVAPDGLQLQAAYGSATGASQRFPLTWRGTTIGALDVAPRSRGEAFNASDQRLLTDLATQIGLAVHTVQLASDLQASRGHIVRSREDERRRLRRDLHDSVGAQLAALAMYTSAIKGHVTSDPDLAITQLEEMRTELRATIDNVRRLVEGLRPPALDELGLEGAIRMRLERLHQGSGVRNLDFAFPEELPVVSAAAEVAAYRIIEEATTNVLRHARAISMAVRIEVGDGLMSITIDDDGDGINEQSQRGLGTHTMQERAAELGGRVEIEPGPMGQGTRVRATIPTGTS